jgi:transcriptional regulator with AAA-type ATPase domain
MNPFKYGTIVTGRDLCGRKSLLRQIIGDRESSQRIVILGERGIGKSSAALVLHFTTGP